MALLTSLVILLHTTSGAVPSHPGTIPASLPVYFTKNMGQWDGNVCFKAMFSSGEVIFRKDGLEFHRSQLSVSSRSSQSEPATQFPDALMPMTVTFVGGASVPQAAGESRSIAHFYNGSTAATWFENVPCYKSIVYRQVWEGIDIVYWMEDRVLQQRIVYRDSSALARVQILRNIDGEDSAGSWDPSAESCESLNEVSGNAVGSGTHVSSLFTGLDAVRQHSFLLTEFCTYFGSSGGDGLDLLKVARNGDIYFAGYTSNNDIPVVSPGRYAEGGCYLAKLSCDGKTLLFFTYLGCIDTACFVEPHAMSIGPDGSIVLGGRTRCPCLPITTNALFPTNTFMNMEAPFLMRFTPAGYLSCCSFIGSGRTESGWSGWQYLEAVAQDAQGNVFVVGTTDYDLGSVSPWAYQKTVDSASAFILKLTPECDSILYCTYYGKKIFPMNIVIDDQGQAVIGGILEKNRGGIPLKNAHQPTRQPESDMSFIAKLNSMGSDILFSTYVGGIGRTTQSGQDLALDAEGNVFALYTTSSSGLATLGAYQIQPKLSPADSTYTADGDLYIAKYSKDGVLCRATYCGGTALDFGNSLSIDKYGRVFVLSVTSSRDYPLKDPYDTSMGYPKWGITVLDSTLSSIEWSTLWSIASQHSNTWCPLASNNSCSVDDNSYLTFGTYSFKRSGEDDHIFHALYPNRPGGGDGLITRFFLPDSLTMRIPASIDAPDTVRVNRARGIAFPAILDIRARFMNAYDRDAIDARAEIVLPTGFHCEPDPLDTLRAIGNGTIPAHQSVETSWLVAVDPLTAPAGTHRVYVNSYFNDPTSRQSCPPLATQNWTDIVVIEDNTWTGELACALDAADTVAALPDVAYTDGQALFTVRNVTTATQAVDDLILHLPRGMGVACAPASDTLAAGGTLAPGEALSKPWTLRISARPTDRRIGLEARALDALGNVLALCEEAIVCPGQPVLGCATEGPDTLRCRPAATDTLRVACRLINPLDTAQALRDVTIDLSSAPHLSLHAGQPSSQGPFPLAARFRRVAEWTLDATAPSQETASDTVRFRYRTDAATGSCERVIALRRLRWSLICAIEAAPGDTSAGGYRGEALPLRCTVRNDGPLDWPGGTARLSIVPAGALASAEDTLRAIPAISAGQSAQVQWTLAAPTSRFDRAYTCGVDILDSGIVATSCSAGVDLRGMRGDVSCTATAPDTLHYDVASDRYTPDPFNAVLTVANALDTAQTAIETVIDLTGAPHLKLTAGEATAKSMPVIAAHGTEQAIWRVTIAASSFSPVLEMITMRYRHTGDTAWSTCTREILVEGEQRIISAACMTAGHDTLWADVHYEQIIPQPLQVQYTIANTGNAPLEACTAAIVPPPMYRLANAADSIQQYGIIPSGLSVAREWLLELDPSQAQFGTSVITWVAGCANLGSDSTCTHTVTLAQGSPCGIVLSPWMLRFRAEKDGPLPPAQTVSLWPGGGLAMPWQLQPDAAWVDVQPAAGTRAQSVAVRPTTTSLAEGVHAARIDVVTSAMAVPSSIDVAYEIALMNDAEHAPSTPAVLWMDAPYPQPAGNTVSIVYGMERPGSALLAVYDALGRRVATLADVERAAGRHVAVMDVGALPPGVYVCVLSAGSESVARLMVLR